MAISQSELTAKSYAYQEKLHTNIRESATATTRKTAFLCHSHRDDKLVKGLLVIFREMGVDLYIDWQDHTMPDTPNAETARKIQTRIKACDQFLFLATENSKASRWCPWEIGYADSSSKGIYIIPTSDGRNNYGNEYLELYPRIDSAIHNTTKKEGYAIFHPGKDTGPWLSSSSF